MSSSTDQFPDSSKSVSKSKSKSKSKSTPDEAATAPLAASPEPEPATPATMALNPPKREVAEPNPEAKVESHVAETPPAAPSATEPTTEPEAEVDAEAAEFKGRRQQPIPPPSEPKQYRAIGLVLGRYVPSEEQFNRGFIHTDDGVEIEAVLLGRVTSLVKKHLDPEQMHLWVVYPRTREKEENLHLQIVGVWEPENLHQGMEDEAVDTKLQAPQPRKDYFSIRGEIISYEPSDRALTVKILQMPRRKKDTIKAFRLNLVGDLPGARTVGHFWDLHIQREGKDLLIQRAQRIAMIMPRKTKRKRGGPPRQKFGGSPRRPGGNREAATGGGSSRPTPKPVSRQERSPSSTVSQDDS